MEKIMSRQNPRVKHMVSLHDPRKARQAGEIVLEGPHLLHEALSTEQEILEVFMTEEYRQAHPSLPEEIPVTLVTEEVLQKAAATKTPQGLVVRARRPCWDRETVLGGETLLILDHLQDPGNVGTLIRTAAAAGLQGLLLLGGCPDPFHPKVLRSSAGAVFRLPHVLLRQEEDLGKLLSSYHICIAEANMGVDYRNVKYDTPLALLLGSEARGVRKELKTMDHTALTIPLQGGVESLNVGAAGAVLMFALMERLGEA